MSKESNSIVIGTNNAFKVQEINFFLDGLSINTIPLSDLPTFPEIIEDGDTLLENAVKKGLAISAYTEHLVITSDAGWDVPALTAWDYRRPKRNLGERATEAQKIQKMMKLMSHLQGGQRKAVYMLALCLAKQGQVVWSKEFFGYEGWIVEHPDLSNIGKDLGVGRMWFLPEFGTTEDRLNEDQRLVLRRPQIPVRAEIQAFLQTCYQ